MKKTTQRLVINLPSDVSTRLRQTARAQGLTVSQVVLRSVRRDPLLVSRRSKLCSIADLPLKYNVNQKDADETERALTMNRPTPPIKYRDLSGLVAKKGEIDFKAWRKSIAEMDVIHPDDWK